MKRSKLFILVLTSPMILAGLTSCNSNNSFKHEKFVKDENLDYLYDVTYNNYSWSDVNTWMNSKKNTNPNQGAFGCSSIHFGDYYGRSFDFCFTTMNEFLVRTKNENGHLASIGVSIADCNMDETRVQKIIDGKGGENELLAEKLIPFAVVDGINEKGVVCNTNVVPAHDLDPLEGQTEYHTIGTNPGATDLFYQFMPRYILDNAVSAKHAVELLKQHNLTAVNKSGAVCDYFGIAKMGYELHCMIADKKETYVVEMVDNQLVVLKSGSHIMTNYYLSNISATGQGFERYATLFNHWQKWKKEEEECNVDTMGEAIHDVMYSEAYNPDLHPESGNLKSPKWPTEFAGGDVPFYQAEKYCEDHWEDGDINLKDKLTEEYNIVKDTSDPSKREEKPGPAVPWISTHAEVFDIKNKTLHLVTQEKENDNKYVFESYKL